MILEIPAVLARLLPERFASGATTVVRVQTTRPLFLVFANDAACPACVVQLGPQREIERAHRTLTTLHQRLPRLVPASLACGPGPGGTYAHIQSGLPGTSWFRIRDRFREPSEWSGLADRAVQALRHLHTAVQASAEWHARVCPGEALRGQRAAYVAQHVPLAPHVSSLVDASARDLDRLDAIPWFWQHGDFCLNNLLVAGDRLGIIDFEEFGETAVPLHDQFSLALSLHDFAPARGHRSDVAAIVAACIQPTLVRHSWLAPHTAGLFLHHLLWRINQCRDRPGRAAIRRQLVERLDTFASEPARFLPGATELARAS